MQSKGSQQENDFPKEAVVLLHLDDALLYGVRHVPHAPRHLPHALCHLLRALEELPHAEGDLKHQLQFNIDFVHLVQATKTLLVTHYGSTCVTLVHI